MIRFKPVSEFPSPECLFKLYGDDPPNVLTIGVNGYITLWSTYIWQDIDGQYYASFNHYTWDKSPEELLQNAAGFLILDNAVSTNALNLLEINHG